MLYVYLAVGGVIGTFGRYGLGRWVHTWAGVDFPWGTLAVNVLGSLLLGVAIRGAELAALSPEMRAMLTVGFCGAFTTFSTFSFETISLMQTGAWGRASLYAAGSLGVGLVAMAVGLASPALFIRVAG